jgi:catechol 2,3-dioxygenase-like lactoylglutathione lyase family enzyme
MTIMELDHVAVGVKNLDAVISILVKEFGFTVVRKGKLHGGINRLAFLKEPNTGALFEIVELSDKDESVLMHFAFRVNNVDSELEKLRKKGFDVVKEPHDIPAAKIRSALLDAKSKIKIQLLTPLTLVRDETKDG